MIVFVPLARRQAAALQAEGSSASDRTGYAATPALLRAHGFDVKADEDANFTAQTYAMVAGLNAREPGERGRIVLAADVPVTALDDRDNADGEVDVAGLEWRWVQAVFSDGTDPSGGTTEAVDRAAESARGVALAAAVDLPAVEELIDDHDLLWHVPDEPW